MKSLYDLYQEHHSNVGDKQQAHLHYYNTVLAPLRDKPVRILQIGLQNRASLEIWAKFFPNAEAIIGCDIDPECGTTEKTSPIVKTVIGASSLQQIVDDTIQKSKRFDLVVDASAHPSADTAGTFLSVFNILSQDGQYICEDVYRGYSPDFEGGNEDTKTALSFFRRLSELAGYAHRAEALDAGLLTENMSQMWGTDFPSDMLNHVQAVTFTHSMCHIQKTVQGIRTKDGFAPLDAPSSAPNAPLDEEASLKVEKDFQDKILTDRMMAYRDALTEARRRPLKLFLDKLTFKLLKAILRSGLPMSDKTRARYDKSARKRDPLRSQYDTPMSHDRALDYAFWMDTKEQKHHLTDDQVALINTTATQSNVKISVIIPVYNPAPNYLEDCINSVRKQSFSNWELCIADDASTDPDIWPILQKHAAEDARIKIVLRAENGHISAASNSALDMATGTYVALMDHDDMLPEHALAHVAKAIIENPDARLIYSDEDKLDDNGQRIDPHFKSDWNRDLFYTHNYITHLSVLDKRVVDQIGGFRLGYEGAQDYDLLLRAIALFGDKNILHIPKILYHWRAHSGSTAQTAGAKSYTHDAGKKALSEFLRAHEDPNIVVQDSKVENLYHAVWPVPDAEPSVAIIIPTRDQLKLLDSAVTSILKKTAYQNYEIIIVDNASVESETLDWFEKIQSQNPNVRVLSYDEPFNYSSINNFAVEHTNAEVLALVNNDIEVIEPLWLREMVGHAIRHDIGCVGAKLHYTNGQIQHGGVIIGLSGMAGHSHKYYDGTHHGYFGRLFATQNLSAVTGACLVVKKSLYEKVNGLDAEHLAVAFNDIDLCLKVQAEGYRNLWSPHASLFHHESISRGEDDTPEKKARFQKEADFMVKKWKPAETPDPYYNPNLTLIRDDFSIDIS